MLWRARAVKFSVEWPSCQASFMAKVVWVARNNQPNVKDLSSVRFNTGNKSYQNVLCLPHLAVISFISWLFLSKIALRTEKPIAQKVYL
ncbi:MAG: hypothetical protein DI617_02920 [Streptococcus pyogenes]|nr:MAG: hypothetical protein DI617_02920 [Streptococcus pyogenes]